MGLSRQRRFVTPMSGETLEALADLSVVDISAVWTRARAALPLVMICAASWLQLATSSVTKPRWSINDEGWALLRDPATARWGQSSIKFSRQLGISVVNVMHRLSDLTTDIGRGRGLWLVGGETREVALVDHALSDIERELVDTDDGM